MIRSDLTSGQNIVKCYHCMNMLVIMIPKTAINLDLNGSYGMGPMTYIRMHIEYVSRSLQMQMH